MDTVPDRKDFSFLQLIYFPHKPLHNVEILVRIQNFSVII